SNDTAITILWATQSGRAKACARRTIRLLQSSYGITNIRGRCTFDDMDFLSLGHQQLQQPSSQQQRHFLILFVSTTGDAEQTSSIQKTWSQLLSKSLPNTHFANVNFALFALGDRAYGPDAFCAAGRKLAARMVQLGAKPVCCIGYGDDGSLNGGVFADLDVWLEKELFPVARRRIGVEESSEMAHAQDDDTVIETDLPYEVAIMPPKAKPDSNQDGIQEWQREEYSQYYCSHFKHSCPTTAYQYNHQLKRRVENDAAGDLNNAPLLGRVTVNDRITANDWMQDTRHTRVHVLGKMDTKQLPSPTTNGYQTLPYQAGDVATIIPSNPSSLVERFLSVLPPSIHALADEILHIQYQPNRAGTTIMNHPWPERCTLRGLLTHCTDIQSLPEREDLFALSAYCNSNHTDGKDQRDKLISLSETAGAALYGDYIIREKRNWVDVFYDFDSMCWEDKKDEEGTLLLTISHVLTLLPSISPRHFSIASSPSFMKLQSSSCSNVEEVGFELELCVAIVEGTTPFGRTYTGCCSKYLASITPSGASSPTSSCAEGSDIVRLWIHPGSFSKLPMSPLIEGQDDTTKHRFFKTPVMCIGAGTGIAPLRSLIFEREAQRLSNLGQTVLTSPSNDSDILPDDADNILVFGCRKKVMDYYYGNEWEKLTKSKRLHLIPAFSRDQKHKLYVQRALREANGGELIARHMLEQQGAVYIAGGSKMARAVKDEIVEALGARLDGGEKDAKRLLNKMKRTGLFSIEAWS
ncbi:hypothetical protein ACHAXR_007000, partial [Thalassiosira sp. AJA248-18]